MASGEPGRLVQQAPVEVGIDVAAGHDQDGVAIARQVRAVAHRGGGREGARRLGHDAPAGCKLEHGHLDVVLADGHDAVE